MGIQLAPFSLALAVMMLVLGMIIFSHGHRPLRSADRNPGGMGRLVPAVSHAARHGRFRPDSLAVVSAWLRGRYVQVLF